MFGKCFHNWEVFNKVEKDTFLGKPCPRSYPVYRRCTKPGCGVVQEYFYSESNGECWFPLNSEKAKIFNSLTPQELKEQSFEKAN